MKKLTQRVVDNTNGSAATNSKELQKSQTKLIPDTQKFGTELLSVMQRTAAEKGRREQYLGTIVIAFFGVIALILGLKGHEWLAGSIATTVVINIAGILNTKS